MKTSLQQLETFEMGMQNVEDFYPLSPMQQGLLFHTLSAPDTGVYFNQLVCTLVGQLNIPVFERVWQQVIQRHSILRTCFRWEGIKEPVQIVLRQVQLPLKHYNWQDLSSTEQQEKLAAFLESDRTLGLDLTQAPLMRLALIQLSENTYQFVWNTHHLITDGWSTSLLLEEVFKFYTAFCQGKELQLAPPRPYRDYIKWLHKQDLTKAEAFWRQTLSGFSAPTNLRIEKSLSSTHNQIKYATQQIKLSASQTAAMRSLVRQQQITLNTLLQGAWAWLLSYYSGETDVLFGVTVSGRPVTLVGAESMAGLFINSLPLRVQVAADTSVVAFLKHIQAQQAEISQYEYSPLVQVQRWSEIPRGMTLFNSILVFENYPVDTSKRQIDNLEILNVVTDERTNYPLTVTVVPSKELSLEIAYNRDRFDDDAMTRMLGHLNNLLAGIVTNPQQRLSDLPLLTEAEKQTLLVKWNNTQTEYPQNVYLHQLFEAQVEKTPNAVAVVHENQHLTYQHLNQKANQLAHYLQKHGVAPEVLVGICLERSLEMIVGLLAILKAGGAYLPLDPAYPQERLAYMLADAQVSVLLTQESFSAKFSDTSAQVICIDNEELIIQQPQTNLINQNRLDNLAYVIYTSGSTGKPKGVMIEQASLVNYTQAAITEYKINSSDRILQFASISFDAAAEEIFPCLVQGATLVLRTDEMLTSISYFLEKCRQQSLTILDLPTAFWQQLTSELYALKLTLPLSVRLVIIGGEKASTDKVLIWQKCVDKRIRLVNSYGPTETTVVATTYDLSEQTFTQEIPIGKAISNIQTYILDRYLQPVPIGIPGELYISGQGVARGYLNQPELTAEKFIPNPFDTGDTKLYKTGDLVRYRSDGNIEILGRVDQQVKIRGFRIELGEIEAKLIQHLMVQDSVVVVIEDNFGDKRLVAYIVPNTQNNDLEKNSELIPELRQLLKASLPNYMLPSAFVLLDKLPLTPNGKIDRKALSIADQIDANIGTTYRTPRTPVEEKLAKIWADLLKVKQVGIEDNFFDLGGHSLLLTQLVFQVRQTWQIELPLSSLWEMPTIASLAQSIETAQKMGYSTVAMTSKSQINWQAEAVLDSAILPKAPIEYLTEPAKIFLTGATGFVGSFLLYELLQQTRADIYCLVRAANTEEGKNRIKSSLESYLLWDNSFSPRIIAIVGNLSEPLLGLSQQKFQEMAELVDVIYHNGALVHHAFPYATLKAANVLGTQEVLRLASQGKVKPVHFMSTDGVFSAKGYSGVKVVREQDSLDDYQVPSSGYTQSKWVAEKLVTIARDRGLPVCIYRIGRVSGHSQTGVFNRNDFLYRLIVGCIKLEKVPDANMIEDIAPVDYISKAIVYLSKQEQSLSKAFHFVNSQPLHSNTLIKLLRGVGYSLQQVSEQQWQAALINIAEHHPEHPLFPLVPLLNAPKTHNSILLKFDCQNTTKGLANTAITCPPVDENLLNTYLSYLIKTGVLETPKQQILNI
ncbi:non-ribosomal peptide synthetase [Gloeocapsa sp. PCC 7428]|uniref:non-ribosomal peptide synthetase n=1 Tax=Gloeocapsa sp. PCC 7428 TaxID=1173026 RepID=UPI001E48FCA9|nr:non-ribosomal peptide synthetase [Gloeocapsa sp. PCC 7428]